MDYKFLPFVADKYGDQLVPKVGRFLIRLIALYDKVLEQSGLTAQEVLLQRE
jgi:hypothetical protein